MMAKLALPEFLLDGAVSIDYPMMVVSGYDDDGSAVRSEVSRITFTGVIIPSDEIGDSGKLEMSIQGESVGNRYILYYPVGTEIETGQQIISGDDVYNIGRIKAFSTHNEAILTKVDRIDGIYTQ